MHKDEYLKLLHWYRASLHTKSEYYEFAIWRLLNSEIIKLINFQITISSSIDFFVTKCYYFRQLFYHKTNQLELNLGSTLFKRTFRSKIHKENYLNTLVSSITAHKIWVFCMAIRRLFNVSWWYSWVPCEKLNRATFIPALSSFSHISTEREAGPSVHTIFVFGTRPSLGRSFKIPSMSMFDILST